MGQCQGKTPQNVGSDWWEVPALTTEASRKPRYMSQYWHSLQRKCLTKKWIVTKSVDVYAIHSLHLDRMISILVKCVPSRLSGCQNKEINTLLWYYVIYLVHVHTSKTIIQKQKRHPKKHLTLTDWLSMKLKYVNNYDREAVYRLILNVREQPWSFFFCFPCDEEQSDIKRIPPANAIWLRFSWTLGGVGICDNLAPLSSFMLFKIK